MARRAGCDGIYAAATMWKERCLLADGSVFGSGEIWTAEHATELVHHFVEKPDAGQRSFEEKLKDQLAHVSSEATQLAAEMLWVMMLFPSPSSISRDRKTELVRTVWDWSSTPLHDTTGALDALADGIGSGGTGYNNYRPFELHLLVRFTAAWKALAPAEQSRLSADAWAFAAWFDRLPDAQSRQLRHMLLHLLFPDEFERIASRGDKWRIDEAFSKRFAGAGFEPTRRRLPAIERDRRLRQIRRLLEREYPGGALDFYGSPELESVWRAHANGNDRDEPPRPGSRAWVIGAGEGATRWPSFSDGDYVAIGWDELDDLEQYKTRDALQARMKQVYEREQDPSNDSLACYQFCREMTEGDEVYVKQGRDRILGYGHITGPYEHDESRPDYRNVRRVEWLSKGNWLLPEAARIPLKTLTEVTKHGAFRTFLGQQIAENSRPDDEPPYGIDDVMQDAFLSYEAVEEILRSLKRQKNLILQGPPGVGKSFLARRLAYALIGAEVPDNVQMIQFHQSYAYEDFIQGWRPNGNGGFVLRNGVFYEFCRRAQDHPAEPHVFVIDEINRGNMSKVFGELLLLIEADKRGPEFAIPLTYSESATDTFYVPENVYLIGLMNTADRSLAMVDYALRRRFAFRTLRPAFDSPAFARALRQHGVDDATITRIIERVDAVNTEIGGDHKNLGPGFAIGHSYFCPTSTVSDSQGWYDAIVRDELEPLLREYWFDDDARVERCLNILQG